MSGDGFSRPLGELVDERGITYGIVQPGSAVADGVPILRVNNFTNNGTLQLADVLRVDASIEANYQRSRLRGGEVLVTLVGSAGRVAVAPPSLEGWNVARAVGVIPVRADLVDPRWVAWCVEGPVGQKFIDVHLNTTVQSTLNLSDLRRVPIPLPPAGERETITAVLSALDEKIECNLRVGELANQVAERRFAAMIQADSFSCKPISAIAAVKGGATPSTSLAEYWGGPFAWATPKDLAGLPLPVLLETGRTLSEAGLAQISSGLLPRGAVLLSSRAPIGYLAIADLPVAINQGFIALVPNGAVSSEFLLHWAKWAMPEILSRANGTTFQEINKVNFRPIEVPVPTQSELDRFDGEVHPLHELMVASLRENAALQRTRDYLLPRLLDGRLRVRDAEKVVESAT